MFTFVGMIYMMKILSNIQEVVID